MTPAKEDIRCPTCEKEHTWFKENPDRPFCSYRCKLIDLGAWATEEHRIPSDDATSHELDDPVLH